MTDENNEALDAIDEMMKSANKGTTPEMVTALNTQVQTTILREMLEQIMRLREEMNDA